jgi:hypothetical protein
MTTTVKILTANRLADGAVVYWQKDGWQESLAAAAALPTQTDADAAMQDAERSVADRIVVSPYLFAARVEADGLHPIEEREIIRAAGPTIRRDLGKQADHVPL